MKYLFLLCLIFHCLTLKAQSVEEIDQQTAYFLERIDFWDEHELEDETDSLSIYNHELTEFLSNSLCANPQTFYADFELAKSRNFVVTTSPDQKIRIYSWNTQTGGTMQYYNSILTYSCGANIVVQPLIISGPDENGALYFDIRQIMINQKTHYIISSVNIGSSAVFSYLLETKTIHPNGELVESSIIKDGADYVSSLRYQIDFSIETNNQFTLLDVEPVYDSEKRQIILPKMNADYELSTEKIIYPFDEKSYGQK